MTEMIAASRFRASEGVEEWNVLSDGANTFYRTGSFAESARLVHALGELGLDAHPPAVDIRADGVTVRLVTVVDDHFGMSSDDVDAARRIYGARARPGAHRRSVRRPEHPDRPRRDRHRGRDAVLARRARLRAASRQPRRGPGRPSRPRAGVLVRGDGGAARRRRRRDAASRSGSPTLRPSPGCERRSPPAAAWSATSSHPRGGPWPTRRATRRTSPPSSSATEELADHLEVHPPRGPVERAEQRPAEHQHEDDVADGAERVPRERRRRVEGRGSGRRFVARTGAPGSQVERRARRSGTATTTGSSARRTGSRSTKPYAASAPIRTPPRSPCGSRPAPSADPADRDHLERQPRPEPADEQPAREHPDARRAGTRTPGRTRCPATSTTMNIALNPATNPGSRSATIAAPSTPISATLFGPEPAAAELDEQQRAQQDRSERRPGSTGRRPVRSRSTAGRAPAARRARGTRSSAEQVGDDERARCAAASAPSERTRALAPDARAGGRRRRLTRAPPRPVRA